jgi:hypothetical protein
MWKKDKKKVRAKGKRNCAEYKYSFGQCCTSLQRVSWAFLENRIKKTCARGKLLETQILQETGGGRRVESEWGLFSFANTTFLLISLLSSFLSCTWWMFVVEVSLVFCFAGSFCSPLKKHFSSSLPSSLRGEFKHIINPRKRNQTRFR